MITATVNSKRTPSRVAVLTASLLSGALGVARAASPTEDVPRVTVSYGDLDLSSDSGIRTLYQRISAAAREVCPRDDSRELARVALSKSCRITAIERAVRDVNSPKLAALSAEHSRHG